MGTVTLESIPIVVGREDDGRWWADIGSMPGVMAYAETRDSVIAVVRTLALGVAAGCIDYCEDAPESLTGSVRVPLNSSGYRQARRRR